MRVYLDQILASVAEQVAQDRSRWPPERLQGELADLPPPRDFRGALARPGAVGIIAEIKRASPSRGELAPDLDPAALARTYEAHGAAAVSVLTESRYFQAKAADLPAVRAACTLPLLYKGFVLDPYQLLQARVRGADAVLLIVAVLGDRLGQFLEQADRLGLACLVEVHREEELAAALAAGAELIGVNNRDLATFHTDPQTARRLIPRLPEGCVGVAESGIRHRADVLAAAAAGARAVLVGEALVTAPDPGAKLEELRGVDQDLRHP